MEKKILEGKRKSPVKNEVIGGHSPQINNSNDLFAVEELSVNADGTRNVKFVKDLQDGNISKIKKSTVFPDLWSDSWYDDGFHIAQSIMNGFSKDDWKKLSNDILNKDLE
ncbi:MAG: hypothetical protein ACOCM4_02870 [Acetivibrio ethanolgignens]